MADSEDPTALVSPQAVFAYMQGVPEQARQFDFMLGEWAARTTRFRPDGSELASFGGTWRATSLHGGRMLFDEFVARFEDGPELAYMATLRSYCPASERWEMTFLVAHQPLRITSFSGHWTGDEMLLSGSGQTLDGRPMQSRVRFFGISERGFDWENLVSLDDGENWYRDSVIRARRPGV